MTTEKRNDEIDLIEVFQKMANGIKNLFSIFFSLLYSILLFFIRKSILIFIIIVLGLSFGFYQFKTSPRYYSSRLEASSNAISSIDMIYYLNNIHELFKGNDNNGLQSKLELDSLTIASIKDVKAYKAIDLNKDGITDLIDYNEKYETSDTTISRSRFVIKVEVYDAKVFPVIQESILNYINQNNYINNLNTIRKKQLQELIVKLDNEILSLDSLKKTEYFTKEEKIKTQAGQLLIMNEQTTQLYHSQIISLYKQKQEFEKTLELRTDPITIIQDFSGLSMVENNLMTYIKYYGILSLVFAILLSILIENRKTILNIISESMKK